MTRPAYNEKYDYKAAHLSWIANHPNFESKCYSTMPAMKINNLYIEKASYKDIMTEWYLDGSNYIAYLNYYDDLQWLEEQKVIKQHLISKPLQTLCSFVTVGFNHQEFTVKKALEFVNSVLNSSIALDGSFAVMENFRLNGEHPHVHIKLYWPQMINGNSFYKSSLIQAIHRSKHGKKLVLKKEFIDIKDFIDGVHNLYLDGIKTEAKMPCVEKDKAWRSKHNIPDKLFK